MPRITVPNLPEALSYSVLAALAVEALLAIVLAARGEWLGVLLVLALLAILYWFVCRQLVAVVSARFAIAASGIVTFVAALMDLVSAHPYSGLLFMLAAIVLGVAFVLLQQGGVPVELRVGRVTAIGVPGRAAYLRMLIELRDAGLLTEDEFIAKRTLLAL
ncbi:MAG: SHOCT domain-containing protein [Stellaceae bacterium]